MQPLMTVMMFYCCFDATKRRSHRPADPALCRQCKYFHWDRGTYWNRLHNVLCSTSIHLLLYDNQEDNPHNGRRNIPCRAEYRTVAMSGKKDGRMIVTTKQVKTADSTGRNSWVRRKKAWNSDYRRKKAWNSDYRRKRRNRRKWEQS